MDQHYADMNLLQLTLTGKSPFGGLWDVRLLIQEIEENLDIRVTDITFIDKGSNMSHQRESSGCTCSRLRSRQLFGKRER